MHLKISRVYHSLMIQGAFKEKNLWGKNGIIWSELIDENAESLYQVVYLFFVRVAFQLIVTVND